MLKWEEVNGPFISFADCHESCDGSCNEEGPKGCQACKTGYTMSDDEGCKGVLSA